MQEGKIILCKNTGFFNLHEVSGGGGGVCFLFKKLRNRNKNYK